MKAKKEAFTNWRTSGYEMDKEIYKENRKTAKINVTKDMTYEDKLCMIN